MRPGAVAVQFIVLYASICGSAIVACMASNTHGQFSNPDPELMRAVVDVLVLGEPYLLSLWQDSGLTLTQIRVLKSVHLSCPSAGLLAHEAGVPPSSLSRILERLEHRGLVMREIDREDRRRVRIVLTDAGSAFLGTLPRLGATPLGRALADLTQDEREAFMRGAAALAAASRRGGTADESRGLPVSKKKGEAHVVRGA